MATRLLLGAVVACLHPFLLSCPEDRVPAEANRGRCNQPARQALADPCSAGSPSASAAAQTAGYLAAQPVGKPPHSMCCML